MTSRKSGLMFIIVAFLLLAVTGTATAQEPQPAAIVSAASFRESISPSSIASIFGTDLADGQFDAEFDQNGNLPTILGGVSVEIDGNSARLIFVSPGQINLVVPEGVDLGMAEVRVVTSAASEKGEPPAEEPGLSVNVDLTAPGIFAIQCLRADEGAVLNGVTFRTGPFRVSTEENPGEDKRTRLAIFATGIRYAGNPERKTTPNVAASLMLEGMDARGNVCPIALEYAGPAPDFDGLDQLNAVLSPELEGIGLIWLRLRDGDRVSNSVSVVISPDGLGDLSVVPGYEVVTVAGTGESGFSGDGAAAVLARLQTPVAVAVDRFLNLFVADSENGVVRRIGTNGVITTVAGTAQKGASGDGGLATEASLQRPVGVAVDLLGNLFIADADDHRVRRVDPTGVITTLAGTGVSGFSGDGGLATAAQLSSPTDVATNLHGSVVIADTGNNRLRMVTSDGRIQTIAGTGEAGFSGDYGPAIEAQLSAPNSVAVGRDGTVYFGDSGNDRVRSVSPNGTIGPLTGGDESDDGPKGPVGSISMEPPMRVAVDPWGRLFIGDGAHHHVHIMGAACSLDAIAGTGDAGFSGDGGAALDAEFHTPLGLAVDAVGDVFIADSGTHHVRKLWAYLGDTCGEVAEIVIDPPVVVGGQSSMGYVRLSCPVESDTTIDLTSDNTLAPVPPSVVIPAGQTTVPFEILTAPPQARIIVTITGTGGGTTGTGTLTLLPPPDEQTIAVILDANILTGGENTTGLVTLGIPAPEGGLDIDLTSDDAAAEVAASVHVPAGHLTAQFLVATLPVETVTSVMITGALGEISDGASLLLLPDGTTTGDLPEIGSLTLDPSVVDGGENSEGTVTLTQPAPAGGAVILLASADSAADVPSQIVIPEGETSGMFEVTTSTVPFQKSVEITATAGNSASADLRIQVGGGGDGPGEGTIQSLSISPSSVEGGDSATGTVTLSDPAPEGGILVDLSSNDNAADVPSSITIPEGSTQRTFNVSTSSVESETVATITATSANSASDTLTIEPGDDGPDGPGEGTIQSLSISPSSVEGGDSATGTVTLSDPAPEGGILVELSSDDNAADVPSSIIIPEGETERTFNVSTSSVETETVATITATSANSASDTLTIEPEDDGPGGPGEGTIQSLSISPSSVEGGDSATGTVTLSDPAPEGGILVDLSSDDNAADVPSSIIIPEGDTQRTFSVSTSSVETETVATITATSANSTSDTLTIEPEDDGPGGPGEGTIQSLNISPGSVDGGDSATGTVTLSDPAPEGGILVEISSDDDAADVPSSIVIPEGETQGTFEVDTSPVGEDTVATVTATSANSTSDTLTIKAPCVDRLTLSVDTVLGGGSVTGTVRLTSPAPAGGAKITLVSSDAELSVPSTVTVLAGQTTATFQASTVGVVTLLVATIEALFGDCPGITVDLEIESPILQSLGLSSSSVPLLGSVTGTVILNGPAPAGGIDVDLDSSFSLPLGLNLLMPNSVTVLQGDTSADFTISTLGVLLQSLTGTISATLDGVEKTKSLTITVLP